MSLDSLAKKLDEGNFDYTLRQDGSMEWPLEGRYVKHTFIVVEESVGRLRVSVAYPMPILEDAAGLQRTLDTYIGKTVQTRLVSAGRILELFIYSTSATIGDDAEALSVFADDVQALLAHVAKTGYWNANYIGLALIEPEECEGRA